MTHALNAGKLIVFEGIDGAGKSTLTAHVASLLRKNNLPIVATCEPGGTPGGIAIRTLIKDRIARAVPEAECLLFAADKALHMTTVVLPALERGLVVLSDRMADSLYAYQGWGNGVDFAMIRTLNSWTMRGTVPDLTVYLMIDYTTAQQRVRAKKRSEEIATYDSETAEFFRRVTRGYEELYAGRPDVLRLDATRTIEENAHAVYQRILPLVGLHDT